MIYCGITIDYLAQLERSGHRESQELLGALRGVAASLGGSSSQKDHPLVLSFSEEGPFGILLAAEAIHRAAMLAQAAAPSLRGVSVGVHATGEPETVAASMEALRFEADGPFSCRLTEGGLAALADRLPPPAGDDRSAWRTPLHATALADADLSPLASPPELPSAIGASLASSASRLVATPAFSGSQSVHRIRNELAELAGLPLVVALPAARSWVRPFSPFVDAFDASFVAGLLERSPPERGKRLSELRPAFELASSSPLSSGLSPSTARGCLAFLDELLDTLGDEGAVLVCEAPERFSREALELIGERLSSGRGAERYVALVEDGLPNSWDGPHAFQLRLPRGGGAQADRPASGLIGSAAGRVGALLEARAEAMAGTGRGGDGLEALSALPAEAALYLHGLHLAEDALSPAEAEAFFASLGLPAEGARLLQDLLVRSGLADPAKPTAPLSPADPGAVAEAVGTERARDMEARFASFLIDRYRHGAIRPSLGFLRRVGECRDEEWMLFDCLFEDALGGGPGRKADRSFLSPSSAGVLAFWSALQGAEREAAESAAALLAERAEAPRAPALAALAKSELAYAAGDGERAGLGAREALRAMGRGAPPKLEARAQRMMGLSALADERYTEASDYLANAQELAETRRDDYERMMAAYAKAVAEFMNGSLGRALRDADHADESARRIFRIDALAALESLRGRIDLELGAYDEAARRYQALARLGSEYGIRGVEPRASIWRGRALAYAGSYLEALDELERYADDPEARAFRGELEILRGRPRDARPWLDFRVGLEPRRFKPSDYFDWSSSLSEIEGRCLGFGLADAPLEDMRLALSCFARGLDERDPQAALELYALTRGPRSNKSNPAMGTYCFFCFLLEERLPDPPVDKQSVLSRAFKSLQQRAGRIEDRAQRSLYMEKNAWNRRLLEASRTHKFI